MAKTFEAFPAAGVKPEFGTEDQKARILWPRDRGDWTLCLSGHPGGWLLHQLFDSSAAQY